MKSFNAKIEKNINKILSIFFILQPILDVVAAFTLNYLNIQLTISSIFRFLFMFFCIYYLIFIKSKKNLVYILLFFIYLMCFSLITVCVKDFNALFFELKNVFNVFYFPIILIALSSMFKRYNIKIDIKNIVYLYLIYLLLILIPNITHTAFMSYSEAKEGFAGWFLSANSVGNIMIILFPLIILYTLKFKGNILFKLFLIISSLFVFTSMGTKTPLLGFLLCVFITFIYYVFLWIKEKRIKEVFIAFVGCILLTTLSVIFIPKTSFYKNIQIHKNYLGITSYSEVFKDYRLLDHFVFSQRLTFLTNTSNNYNNVDIFQKLFGIGYIENYSTDFLNMKTIEIDYFDILYRNGILGFSLFFSIVISIFIQNKNKFSNDLSGFEILVSHFLILLLAFFCGHVLISPSVSIIVIFVFLIYYQGGFYEKVNKK